MYNILLKKLCHSPTPSLPAHLKPAYCFFVIILNLLSPLPSADWLQRLSCMHKKPEKTTGSELSLILSGPLISLSAPGLFLFFFFAYNNFAYIILFINELEVPFSVWVLLIYFTNANYGDNAESK